jgi:hypothetical protein
MPLFRIKLEGYQESYNMCKYNYQKLIWSSETTVGRNVRGICSSAMLSRSNSEAVHPSASQLAPIQPACGHALSTTSISTIYETTWPVLSRMYSYI